MAVKLLVLLFVVLAFRIAGPALAQIGACCIPPRYEGFELAEVECATMAWLGLVAGAQCEPPP